MADEACGDAVSLVVDDLVASVVSAWQASAIRGPAWCFRHLDLARQMEDAQRSKVLAQAGALGLTNDGDVIRLMESGR